MKFEKETQFEKKISPEKIPNKSEEITVYRPENEKKISPLEFNTELQVFRENKNDSLARINEVREGIGLPKNVDDLPYEVVQAERQLKSLYNKLGKGDYVDFEKLKNDESETDVVLKNKEEQPEVKKEGKPSEKTEKKTEENNTEKGEEKPLEIGDEIYKDGVFYKIHDFMPEYDEGFGRKVHAGTSGDKQGTYRHFDEKEHRWVATEEKRVGDSADKQKELDNKPNRNFRAVIVGGGISGGKGGFSHLTENVVTRVTPELKEKILKMQKESGRKEGVVDHA